MNFTFDARLISPRYSRGASAAMNLGAEARKELQKVMSKFEDGAYEFAARECAICGSRHFTLLAEQDRYGLPIQTTICRDCGLIQTNPDLREQDYIDFYSNHYRRLYIADLVGQPQDFFREEYWRGQKIVEFVRRHARIPQGRLVVEIGCGAGGILQAFSDAGYKVVGIDLGAENLAYGKARGLDLRVGDLYSLIPTLEERPALIVYSHVLEHIREPGQTLDAVRNSLAEDGLLYVEVPGVKDVRNNVFQGDFLKTFHLAHIYNFSLLTLSNLARKHGLSLVSGDETVRSLFKPSDDRLVGRPVSDCEEELAYIEGTERWRSVFRIRFKAKMAMKGVVDGARSLAVGALHRFGLYDFVKRRLTSN